MISGLVNFWRSVMGGRAQAAAQRENTKKVGDHVRGEFDKARERAQALDTRAKKELDIQRLAAQQVLMLLNPDLLDRHRGK